MSFTLPDSMTGAASPAKAAVGDKPVFDYIASLPQPHRAIASAVVDLAAATIPGLLRSKPRLGHVRSGQEMLAARSLVATV